MNTVNSAPSERIRLSEVARRAGVGRAAPANWRTRYPDFPKPDVMESGDELYDWPEMQAFMDRRKLPRTASTATRAKKPVFYVLLRDGKLTGGTGTRAQVRLALIEALLKLKSAAARTLAEQVLTKVAIEEVEIDGITFEIRKLNRQSQSTRISANDLKKHQKDA